MFCCCFFEKAGLLWWSKEDLIDLVVGGGQGPLSCKSFRFLSCKA